MNHICISASGPDKAGWVALVADEVAKGGGNVTHAKMMRLGNEFIVLMHVSVDPEQRWALVKNLKRNTELKPLNIRTTNLTRRMTGMYEKPVHGLRIHCIGEDRYVDC
jgi:glycine cleavage system regulatory protein